MLTDLFIVLTLQGGYNTTLVLIGAAALGAAGGMIGVFTLLRRRALISDAISHATLPGVAIAFLIAFYLGFNPRTLPVLLTGAAASAVVGVLVVQWIARSTRLPEDSAIGTVLSTFYGLGLVLLTYIQTLRVGSAAGLEAFLLGSTASMLRSEAELIAVSAVIVALAVALAFKEFGLVAFDPEFAAARGWPVERIDLVILALLLAVIVIGLKAVGLILVIAIVIIPPVAARFWSNRLSQVVWIAAMIGAAGAYVGAAISAIAPNLPTGALIVLTLAAIFLVSLLLSPVRGVAAATARRGAVSLAVRERLALVAMAEGRPITDRLGRWSARRRGWIRADGSTTEAGRTHAQAAARDLALWRIHLDHDPEAAVRHPSWALTPVDRALPPDRIRWLESVAGGGDKVAPIADPAPSEGHA